MEIKLSAPIKEGEVQMVDIAEVVIPARQVRADVLLTNLKIQKERFETNLADINAKIAQLEKGGVKEVAKPSPMQLAEIVK